MATQLKRPVLAQTQVFREGYQSGHKHKDKRFDLTQPISEETTVQIVANLIELALDGEMNETRLRHDCGLLIGWIISNA
jgi:hypothetical protein